MQTLVPGIWWPRGVGFVLAALVAASASFWVLQMSAVNTATSAPSVATAGPVVIDVASVARALGGGPVVASAAAPAASLASRFTLLGVVAGQHSAGAALLSVDGKPAKPYRVGDVIEDGLVLQSVQGRKADLAPALGSPAVLTLELPPLKQ